MFKFKFDFDIKSEINVIVKNVNVHFMYHIRKKGNDNKKTGKVSEFSTGAKGVSLSKYNLPASNKQGKGFPVQKLITGADVLDTILEIAKHIFYMYSFEIPIEFYLA